MSPQRPLSVLALSFLPSLAAAQAQLSAARETEPVPSAGDAADDPAIWVHPEDPRQSVVIGTDKQFGLVVYDLAGNVLQSVPAGRPNNVDLRRGFELGGERVTLVAAGDREDDRLLLYQLDPTTRRLSDVRARDIRLGIDVYGCCLYRSPMSGVYFFFGTAKSGEVEQWRLFDDGSGRVDAALVRRFDAGGQCEGAVADDELAYLYIGEEAEGVWRYGAEPNAGDTRVQVDSTSGGNLTADVEGLGIYYAQGGLGYLIVSSQGDDTFTVYDRRPPHALRLRFELVDDPVTGVDKVKDCDGLDVTNLALGPGFPRGLLVVQDGSNPGGNQNFKLVRFGEIAAAASPPLAIDHTYDPDGSLGCDTEARGTYRDGANPRILTSQRAPRLGTAWPVELDCTGHGVWGTAMVVGFGRRASGIFVGAGELLVNPASRQVFFERSRHHGGVATLRLPIPNDASFCGLRAFVQGACSGAPGLRLSNAIDVVIGI